MKLILLAGQNPLNLDEPVALCKIGDELLLDLQIQNAFTLGFEPLVVLDGADADTVLRSSKKISDVELVYDTNDIPSFMSNLRSGLYGTNRECFVLPIWQTSPVKKAWQQLTYSYHHRELQSAAHLLQPYCPIYGEMTPGYPLFVTASGRSFLKNTKDLLSLSDVRILKAKVAVSQPSITSQVNFAAQDLPELRGAL